MFRFYFSVLADGGEEHASGDCKKLSIHIFRCGSEMCGSFVLVSKIKISSQIQVPSTSKENVAPPPPPSKRGATKATSSDDVQVLGVRRSTVGDLNLKF